ncbi:MAG: T9SS type A sorting domain-containing protein [Candidatus Neomarinimicrobiota bacterium]
MKLIFSAIVTLTLIFSFLHADDGDTPTNLTIDAASIGGVQLSWDTPENYRKEWISHSNLQYFGGIGAGGAPAFYCQKFPDSLLGDYHGMLLKDMAFVPSGDSDSASFQPLVFETSEPFQIPDIVGRTNLVLSAPLIDQTNASLNAWNSFGLNDHVPGTTLDNDIQPSSYRIDSTKTIWFGYWLFNYIDFPAGADVGPANDSLGNVLIWCPNNICFESTLNASAQEGSVLNFDWLIAISLLPGDSSSTEREIILSNSDIDYHKSNNSTFSHSIVDPKITIGPIRDVILDPLIDEGRDISNYFLFENGIVTAVVQPNYAEFSIDAREQVILGPRDPGTYSYYVMAQTAGGLSDSSNVVSVALENNPPGNFSLISPVDGQIISVNASNLNNINSFIWTTAYDTDGQELNYLFEMCNVSDSTCFDTTMIERLYQPTNLALIEYFGLTNGEYSMSWRVEVTDGLDTLAAGGLSPSGADSLRYFTFSTSQLGIDLANIPNSYNLSQNYPNPFNPSTKISYQLERGEFVKFSIFDLNGNLIKNILNNKVNAGRGHVYWDGKNELGQNVSGGIYLYTIETPSFLKTKKMVLLK